MTERVDLLWSWYCRSDQCDRCTNDQCLHSCHLGGDREPRRDRPPPLDTLEEAIR